MSVSAHFLLVNWERKKEMFDGKGCLSFLFFSFNFVVIYVLLTSQIFDQIVSNSNSIHLGN